MQRTGSAPEMGMLDESQKVLKAARGNHDNHNVIKYVDQFISKLDSAMPDYSKT
jgi:hypothetical protein